MGLDAKVAQYEDSGVWPVEPAAETGKKSGESASDGAKKSGARKSKAGEIGERQKRAPTAHNLFVQKVDTS